MWQIPTILASLLHPFMNKLFIILALFIAHFTSSAQSRCTPSLEYVVNTKSGLKMREGPGTNFQVVTYVPAQSTLLVCEELSTPATFEGISGHWRRINYKGKYGYMFDGFLSPVAKLPENKDVYSFKLAQLGVINRVLSQDLSKADSVLNYLNQVAKIMGYESLIGKPKPDIDSLFVQKEIPKPVEQKPEEPAVVTKPNVVELLTETSNYCGDIREIDPGKIWYAVHRNGDYYRMSRAEIQVIKSKYSLSDKLEFDIVAQGNREVAFLISSEELLDTNWRVELPFDYFARNPNKLFPGQQIELYGYTPVADIHNTTLFATGTVVEVGQCPVLENYKIKVTGEMGDKLITQDLTADFSYMGQCGQPEIYWFGDLNQDLYPDIIFVSMGDEGTLFTLFLSDEFNPAVLYRKADEWFNISCKE
jgi:hypothetical protein